MIFITSKQDNFRRCGIEHPRERTEYPDGKFTEEELEILKAEPMLIVEDAGYKAGADKPVEEMTVPELKALCDTLEIEYKSNTKRDDLILWINEKTAANPEE